MEYKVTMIVRIYDLALSIEDWLEKMEIPGNSYITEVEMEELEPVPER
mgnify:FL=1